MIVQFAARLQPDSLLHLLVSISGDSHGRRWVGVDFIQHALTMRLKRLIVMAQYAAVGLRFVEFFVVTRGDHVAMTRFRKPLSVPQTLVRIRREVLRRLDVWQ